MSGSCQRTCQAATGCTSVDYTAEVVKDILLSGIHDPDMRREVLGTSGIEEKSVHDIVCIVEAKDAASNDRPATAAAATSSYKKVRWQATVPAPVNQPAKRRAPKETAV